MITADGYESPEVRALTLHQPYASFMAGGWKTVETRAWATRYTGWVALHAASSIPAYLGLGRRGTLRIGGYQIEKDGPGRLLLRGGHLDWPYRMPMGAVVAVGWLDRCVPIVDGHDHGGVPRSHVSALDETLTYFDADVGSDADVVTLDDQGPYGDFTPGRYAWFFRRVERFPRAVPCRGYQGLWDVDRAGPEVAGRVRGLVELAAAA